MVLSCGGLTGGAIASVEALATGDTMWRCMVPSPSQPHGFRVVPPLKVSRIYAATTYTDEYVFIIGKQLTIIKCCKRSGNSIFGKSFKIHFCYTALGTAFFRTCVARIKVLFFALGKKSLLPLGEKGISC